MKRGWIINFERLGVSSFSVDVFPTSGHILQGRAVGTARDIRREIRLCHLLKTISHRVELNNQLSLLIFHYVTLQILQRYIPGTSSIGENRILLLLLYNGRLSILFDEGDRKHIHVYLHDNRLAEITGVLYFSVRSDKKFDGTIRGTSLTRPRCRLETLRLISQEAVSPALWCAHTLNVQKWNSRVIALSITISTVSSPSAFLSFVREIKVLSSNQPHVVH